MIESHAVIKRDLDRLEEQLKFNKEKCKVQCLEKNNPLQPQKLESCSTEKAAWSQMGTGICRGQQCLLAAARPTSPPDWMIQPGD